MNGERVFGKQLYQRIVMIRIDGVPNILRSYIQFWQYMWILVFVSSSAISCYLIVKSAEEYLKYQVTTSYRLISDEQSLFPTISICSLNPLNTDFYVQLLSEANLTTSIDQDPFNNMIALENYQLQTNGRYLTSEEKRAMFDMDGFIIGCTFLNKPCNMSDFRYIYFPYSLNCLQFNSGYDSYGKRVELRELRASSKFNELSMEIYVGIPNEISSLIQDRGVKITLLKNDETPFKNTPSAIVVKPGLGPKVSVQRKEFRQFNQWPYFYSECLVGEDNTLLKPLDDMTFFHTVIENSYSYAQDTCLLFCYNYFVSRACNCSDAWIRWTVPGFGICLGEQADCADNFYYTVFNVGSYIQDNCISRCPLECNIHRFDNRQSFYKYPDPVYVKNTLQNDEMLINHYANQTDFTENLASNVVKFSVSYDALVYAEAKEEAKIPWDAFLGTIGCHLHLFLGMSAISFVEILEFFLQISLYNLGYSKVGYPFY